MITGRSNPPIKEKHMGKMFEINAFIEVVDAALDNLIARETSSDKRQAMILAKEWSKKYHRVEVNSLILDRDNADYVGDELIAAWENGKETTK